MGRLPDLRLMDLLVLGPPGVWILTWCQTHRQDVLICVSRETATEAG